MESARSSSSWPFPCSTSVRHRFDLLVRSAWRQDVQNFLCVPFWGPPGRPEIDTNDHPPLGGGHSYLSRPFGAVVTNDIFPSFVSPCASRSRSGWTRGRLVPRSIHDPHRFKPSYQTPTPPPPASLSTSNGGGCRFSFPTVKILRRLLTVGILKYFRQSAARAEPTPPVGNAENHFRQVNPPPLGRPGKTTGCLPAGSLAHVKPSEARKAVPNTFQSLSACWRSLH